MENKEKTAPKFSFRKWLKGDAQEIVTKPTETQSSAKATEMPKSNEVPPVKITEMPKGSTMSNAQIAKKLRNLYSSESSKTIDGRQFVRHDPKSGFVESTASVEMSATLGERSVVLDRAKVTGSAKVEGRSTIAGEIEIAEKASVFDVEISGKGKICGTAEIIHIRNTFDNGGHIMFKNPNTHIR